MRINEWRRVTMNREKWIRISRLDMDVLCIKLSDIDDISHPYKRMLSTIIANTITFLYHITSSKGVVTAFPDPIFFPRSLSLVFDIIVPRYFNVFSIHRLIFHSSLPSSSSRIFFVGYYLFLAEIIKLSTKSK